MSRNGLNNKGGRPKGSKAVHTLEAERGKAYIVAEYLKELKPMLEAQIKQAKKGNVYAFDKLSERALGKVTDKENLLSTKDQMKELGISVYEIDRGGDITYHGPGQIVGYPIIKLSGWKEDTHAYLRGLEEAIMLTCNEYGLKPERNPKYTGVWIGNRKIAAIGIKVSRWVTMHGFAFNINTDLAYFGGIIPCGIKDKDVTSLERELGKEIPIKEVKEKLLRKFSDVFEYSMYSIKPKEHFFQSTLNH